MLDRDQNAELFAFVAMFISAMHDKHLQKRERFVGIVCYSVRYVLMACHDKKV